MVRRPWLRRLLWGLGTVLLLLGGGLAWVLLTCLAQPPALPLAGSLGALREDAGGRQHAGESACQQVEGRTMLRLVGTPLQRGRAAAHLTAAGISHTEGLLAARLDAVLGNGWLRPGMDLLALLHNRSVPAQVPPDGQAELLGLSQASGAAELGRFGQPYHRRLHALALEDLAPRFAALRGPGSLGFVAGAAHRRAAGLVLGRAYGGVNARRPVLVTCVVPQEGRAYLSVAWPGFAGVVTGLNQAKIFAAATPLRTSPWDPVDGRPAGLVLREVMLRAGSLTEAVEIITAAPVLNPTSYLLADGETGEAEVLEVTPTRIAARHPQAGLLLQLDHFETPALRADPHSLRALQEGSRVRHQLLATGLRQHSPNLDLAAAVAILRSPDLCQGAEHLVVAEPAAARLWVCSDPGSDGPFIAHSIDGFWAAAAPDSPRLTGSAGRR